MSEDPYICMLSCNESESCKKKAYIAGINEVIKKPIFKAGVQRLLINAGMIKVWKIKDTWGWMRFFGAIFKSVYQDSYKKTD